MPVDQPTQELVAALRSFMDADSAQKQESILKEKSGILLTDQALQLIERNIESHTESKDINGAEYFKYLKFLFESGIKEGLDSPVTYLKRNEIMRHVNILANSHYAEMFTYISEHKDFLFSPFAEKSLNELLELNKGKESYNQLILINLLIRISKNESIDNARNWFKYEVLGNMINALKQNDYSDCEGGIEIALSMIKPELIEDTKVEIGSSLINACNIDKDLDWIKKVIRGPLSPSVQTDSVKVLELTLIQKLCLSENTIHLKEGIDLFKNFEAEYTTRGFRFRGINLIIGNAYLLIHLNTDSNDYQDKNLDEAIKYTEMEVDDPDTDIENRKKGLRTIATCYLNKRNVPSAVEYFEKATETEPDGIDDFYADTRYQLSFLRSTKSIGNRKQEMERRIDDLEKGIRHAKSLTPLWGSMNRDLGNIYREFGSGDPEKYFKLAFHYTEQAELFFTRANDPNEWARIQHNLGTLYYTSPLGDRSANLENAIAAYKRTLQVHTKKDYPQYYGLTNSTLGFAYLARIMGNTESNTSLAIKHLKQAEATLDPETSKQWLGDTFNGLAGIYLSDDAATTKENLLTGLEYLEKAKHNYHANGNLDRELDVLNNMSKAYSTLVDFDISIAEKAINNSLYVLKSAKKENDPFRWANYMRNHAALLFNINRARGISNENNEVLKYLSESLAVYKESNYLQEFHNTLVVIGHVHFLSSNWQMSFETYSQSISAVELLLLSTFTEDGRKKLIKESELAHSRAAYCLVKLGRYEESIIMIESSKARLLGETLAYVATGDESIPEATRKRLSTLQEKISTLEYRMRRSEEAGRGNLADLAEELSNARNALSDLTKEIHANHPYFGKRLNSFKEIADQIPNDGALIAFLTTTSGGYAFVLNKNILSPGVDNIVELPALNADRVYQLLNIGNENSWAALLTELDKVNPSDLLNWFGKFYGFMNGHWEKIMKPIRDRLTKLGVLTGSRLLFLPQGGIWLLGLHAASWFENDELKTFNDDFIISYTPSLFINKICNGRLDKNKNNEQSLFAIGDTVGDLPFAKDEVSLIAGNFQNAIVFTNEEATERNILKRAEEVSYIHLACHGIYDWSNVMHSGITIANNELLDLSTILSKLNLRKNRLVTLSACESGVTDLKGSADEFVGLPSGFVLAGATGVFSTLWRIEDAATCIIMDALYDEMIRKNQAPAVALFNAQQKLRRMTVAEIAALKNPPGDKIMERLNNFFPQLQPNERIFDHPYFWAGFTFIGA